MTLFEDFKKPLNIVFLLLAVAGIILSVFFYYNGRKTKSISYSINEPSSLIYDSHSSSSAIKVIEKDSIPIKDNVYLLTGVIWNNGDIPISTGDVRQKISLNLISAKKILDFKIVKQTDPVIAQFKLNQSSNTSLDLSWKYFDPGYSFKFQIIYTGHESPGFNLSGKVLDIKSFTEFKNNDKRSLLKVIVLLTSFVFFIFVFIIFINLKKRIQTRILLKDKIFFIIIIISTALEVIIFLLNLKTTIPFD